MANTDELGFFRNDYHRPEQKWICGRTDKLPCQLGPDSKGNCRTSFECVPANIAGKWVCARPERLGGKCKPGPSADGVCSQKTEKCTPVRNIRSARGKLTLLIFIITFAVISVIFFAGYRHLIVKPGGVSQKHSYLNTKCEECHVSAYQTVREWALSVIKEKEIYEDYISCLKCHNKTPYVISPHNLSPELLKTVHRSSAGNKESDLKQNNRPTKNVADTILCSDCHKEHQGTKHDLLDFKDMKCGTCHEIESGGKSNHEFTKQPSNTINKNIKMTHESHFNKHFKSLLYSAFVPKDCKECHILSRNTGYISTRNYSVMCMKCHDKGVLGTFSEMNQKGIPVFTIPGIDVKTLNNRKLFIGYWPDTVREELSPFMKFLLSAEPRNADALKTIDGLNLLNLSDAGDSQLEAVKTLAWAIKELLYEIFTKGHEALIIKIQKAAGKTIDSEQLATLSELLPMELFQQSAREWFVDIEKEILSKHDLTSEKPEKNNQLPEFTLKSDKTLSSEEWVSMGGWYSDKFAIYYRPAGHKDRFISGWLNLATSIKAQKQTRPVVEIFSALSGEKTPGACSKCHVISRNSRDIHWGRSITVNKKLNFLKFSHLPHSTVLSEKGCKFCHELLPETIKMQGKIIDETNPIDFVSIKMSTCVACHEEIGLTRDCLNCHAYHTKGF